MDDEDFSFKLDCAPDAVTPKALGQAVSVFNKMLAVANASDWRISRMELHSIDLAAEPVVVDEATERSFATLGVIARLAASDTVSREKISRFSGVLSSLNDLAKETGADVTIASRGVAGTFTPATLTDLNRLLIRGARRSFGHVRGNVDKIILQTTHRTLGLIDRVTQSRIDVRFGPELDSIVKQIQMGMEVDARGFVRANDGELLSMDAEELIIVRGEHHPLVTAEDLEGTIGLDCTGGLGSVDFVSALRDNAIDDTADGGER
ncbi:MULTISPECIES: hypothetical protein [Bifidobacterium]|uniref:FAD linked oxidase n=1 Tax=Bifidobacterium oedipodis TaxID=2675322 RepID=A0A7Y0ENB2_9BIFI|nr:MULTISPECIES: hypothetical protein [Bifidobacterium]MBW3079022.1 hypothetical protein [Bifidobacterium simiiventris]NMM93387.1 FAD linked oxidase [Bifidobacterium sp. DSM 109957]